MDRLNKRLCLNVIKLREVLIKHHSFAPDEVNKGFKSVVHGSQSWEIKREAYRRHAKKVSAVAVIGIR